MQLYKNIQKQIGTKSLLKSFNHLAMSIISLIFIFIYLWQYGKVYIKPAGFYVYSNFTLKQDHKCATLSQINWGDKIQITCTKTDYCIFTYASVKHITLKGAALIYTGGTTATCKYYYYYYYLGAATFTQLTGVSIFSTSRNNALV